MDEYLWPVRNVAEYAYCPRLFYFMEVEGIHIHNADTEAGASVHKKVDAPSNAPAEDDQRPKSLRSLTLTSDRLKLTATLDLAEINGNTAIPIEYRKGRPRDISLTPPPDDPGESDTPKLPNVEPWPTDRIQIGLQAILLREAGYSVPHGILYYAAERRRIHLAIDDALIQESLDTLAAAQSSAAGPRPAPLVNDPRCARCSLLPFCLPDEINMQNSASGVDEPRRLWPARADGIQVVLQTEGVKVGVRGAAVRITDRDGQPVRELPLANVESLALLGSIQISTQAITTLTDRSIPIAFMSSAGRLQAMVDPLDSVTALVRLSQVRSLDIPARALDLSRAIISAKILNQRTLLQRNSSTVPDQTLEDLADQAKKAATANSLDTLRGHEGQAASLYFEHFPSMFKDKELAARFDTHGRKRRPPPDPINAVLSFAYTMLTHDCVAALRLARLEPTIGALHTCRPGRPALACDLMEPFRPLVADSIAVSAFNRGELTAGHFLQTAAGCVMTDFGRKAFFSAYSRRMQVEVTHPIFEYRLSYRRMIMLHARLIAAWLCNEISTLSFLTTR